jgi:FG-GAP-like repeat/PEP-CTERM motif
MFRPDKTTSLLCSLIASYVVLAIQPAQASNISLQGLFTQDDNVQLFDLTVATAGFVDIRSYGYGGGTTSTGKVVSSGGFDTILSLFNGAGLFLADNDDGAGAAVDPLTGLASDARITMNLAPGTYFVALTEFDNFLIGDLPDGFAEAGHPNFTADPSFTTGAPCPGDMFRDISGTAGRCRNGDWTVDFLNVDSVTTVAPVPEPGTIALLSAGLITFVLLQIKRRKRFALIVFAGVFTIAGKAQDPDYTNVGDILNGKRNLLSIDDLAFVSLYDGTTLVNFTLQSSNSQLAQNTLAEIKPSDPSGYLARSGRIFNLPTSTTAILTAGGFTNQTPPGIYLPYLPNRPFAQVPGDPTTTNLTLGAVADFNRDGYDDLVLTLMTNFSQGSIFVATAGDVNNIAAGRVPPFNFGPISSADALFDITVGDFNGDGQPDIAGIFGLNSGGIALAIYTVDPRTLTVSKAAQIPLSLAGNSVYTGSITSGRFTPAGHDQIIVASSPGNGVQRTVLELVDFAPSSLTPQEKTNYVFNSGFPTQAGGTIKVKTAKFGLPTNPYDQIVFMFAWDMHASPNGVGNNSKFLSVLGIDPITFAWKAGNLYEFSDQDCAFDMTTGNFDNRQPDPANPAQSQHNFNSQIALLYGGCNTGSRFTNVINVDPTSFTLSTASTSQVPSAIDGAAVLSFIPSDTQGRSMVLGEPTKLTIQTLDQPTVIAAAPPMHIDFVKPLDGAPDANTTQVMNLSGMPATYYTQYKVDNSNGTQSSDTSTTGMGWSVKESLNLKVQFGNPKTSPVSASADVGLAASQAKKEIDTNGTNNFTSHAFDVSVQTNGSDQVWYTENDFNVWIYPVIGKVTCPEGQPANCPASEQKPLNIQFSAPNQSILGSRAGNILAWYQPPWEPGNIFSYPGNYNQLQTEIPVILEKLSSDTSFSTDSLVETIQANWASGSGTSQSSNATRTYTEEGSLTESGKISVAGSSAQLTGSITAGGSQSFGNLHSSATKLGASTGVGIHKPGGFANPGLYNYSVVPYILGQQKSPQDTINDQPATGIDTFGTIRTVFTVDPTATSAGNWWQTMYSQRPDVAVNHPYRWVASRAQVATPTPRNCRTDGGLMSCYSLSSKTPTDPATSEFHWMRGFFITDATNPGQGPQVEIANAGDQLYLQTRVYNYSLAAMDPATKVHVRFYVQPWDTGSDLPKGRSSLIGESILSPIPPFNSAMGAPLNWVLANTTFDTTPYQDQFLTFWVVVWMQDGNGRLIPDLEGHGLTNIPGQQAASLSDIQEEAYSNNVGFYNSKLYVQGPSAASTALLGTSTGTPATVLQPTRTAVGIGKISVSGTAAVAPGPAVKVSASLIGGPVNADTTTVFFYDGDPAAGGKEFSAERVPFIAAQGSFQVGAPYRAQTCGIHNLFVVVNQGTSSEVVRRADPIRIPCTLN